MNDILFRGKDKKTGEWIYGSLAILKDNGVEKFYIIRKNTDIAKNTLVKEIVCEVIPETVGQYTGLKDREKNRIFDGDIIGVITERKDITPIPMILYIETVCWNKEEAYWGTDGGNGLEKSFTENEVEIIGNIHDNPELLQKRK